MTDNETVKAIVEGIRHNATIRMIGEGTRDFSHLQHSKGYNKVMGDGLLTGNEAAHKEAVRGVNWAYIIWEDVEELYLHFIEEREGIEVKSITGANVTIHFTATRMSIQEYSLPLLYHLSMESHDREHTLGISPFYENWFHVGPRNSTVRWKLEDLGMTITLGALLSPSSHTGTWSPEDYYTPLDTNLVTTTLDYMIATLGWFAMDKIHRVLVDSPTGLNAFGISFLSHLSKAMEKKRGVIDRARTIPLWDLVLNDVDGMLLRQLPYTTDQLIWHDPT